MKQWLAFLLLFTFLVPLSGCTKENPREKYVRQNGADLSFYQRQSILEGKLYIGMPKEAVIASIGKPTRENVDFLNHQEVWYYDYDREFGTRDSNIFETSFVVELVNDKVYNYRED